MPHKTKNSNHAKKNRFPAAINFMMVAALFASVATSIMTFAHAAATTTTTTANITSTPRPTSLTTSTVTFGYLRMLGVDNKNILGGFASALRHANVNDAISGVEFKLEVTTINCTTVVACATLTPQQEQQVLDFMNDLMPSYTAVLKPNHLLAPRIIDHAIAIGGVPVIDPQTVRLADFENVRSQNVINFDEDIRGQLIHLFTFMQQTAGCAYAGILYESFSELPSFVATAQQMFTGGNMPKPPSLNYDTATDAQLIRFFNEDPRRKCFILLMTYATEKVMSDRVNNRLPKGIRYYSPSMIAGPEYITNGSSAAYTNFFYTRWSPPYLGSPFSAATQMATRLSAYLSDPNYAAERDELFPADTVGLPWASDGAYAGSLVMRYMTDVMRFAVGEHFKIMDNSTVGVPIPWPQLLSTMYNSPRSIGDFPLRGTMTLKCPPKPLAQVCFCNSPATTAFIMQVNGTTGIPYVVYDDEEAGERGVASDVMSSCIRVQSSKMYPITMVLFGIKDTRDVSNQRLTIDAMLSTQSLMRSAFRRYVYNNNYAPVAPVRPLRYVPIILDDNVSSTEAVATAVGSYDPFVIIGSIGDTINQSSVLTLMPSITQFVLEDPILTTPDKWSYNLINLLPALADYIHALAAFYAQNASLYTSFHAIASSTEEAVLISKSMATYGFDVPVSSIIVSISATEWSRTMSRWMSSSTSPYPFVLAATVDNPDSVIAAAFDIASSLWSVGRIAVAANTAYFYEIINDQRFTGDMDVIFPCFLKLWWSEAAQANLSTDEKVFANDPTFWYAKMANEFTSELASRVHYDFVTPAADVMYELGFVSTSSFTFGPYYKDDCTAEEIARNERDRICQCSKSTSAVYIYTMQDWQQKRAVTRFQVDMLTCGVVYKPYVPPVVDNSLSTGAIAGIAVGCAIAAIALIAVGVLYNLFAHSRNNRAAPKDSAEPFTVVFTDIQASTALWARAPAAMSEAVEQHHAIMRDVIRRNNGYEVKTIGDSFMIAFKDSHDALTFSIDAQEALFDADWNSEINASYVEILAEQEAEAAAEAAHRAAETANDDSSSVVTTNTISAEVVSISNSVNLRHSQYSILVGQSASVAAGNTNNNNNQLKASPFQGAHKRRSSSRDVSDAAAKLEAANNQHQRNKKNHNNNADEDKNNNNNTKKVDGGGGGGGGGSSSVVPAPFVEGSAEDTNLWNGLRVRIGISRGYGDIRKDPVSLGYDYYGTVVNTAARVEGVGHGGQILITEETNASLKRDFVIGRGAIVMNLGPQPLRGLDAPIKLFQISPSALHGRKFPPLRLHIEADLDDHTDTTTVTTTTSSSAATFTPMELAAQLCATRQFQGIVSVDEVLSNLNVFQTVMSPTKPKWQVATLTKLGDSWGFEKSAKAVLHENTRMKLIVNLMGRVTKTINMNAKRHESTGNGSSKNRYTIRSSERGGGGGGQYTHNTMTENNNGRHNNNTIATQSMMSGLTVLDARSQDGNNNLNNNNNNNYFNSNSAIGITSPTTAQPQQQLQQHHSFSLYNNATAANQRRSVSSARGGGALLGAGFSISPSPNTTGTNNNNTIHNTTHTSNSNNTSTSRIFGGAGGGGVSEPSLVIPSASILATASPPTAAHNNGVTMMDSSLNHY